MILAAIINEIQITLDNPWAACGPDFILGPDCCVAISWIRTAVWQYPGSGLLCGGGWREGLTGEYSREIAKDL